jgi:3,4-dihydroxyphenylacetate 2,3-dioxygenase
MTEINTNWQKPEFNVIRCAHAELIVTDLQRSRAFYVDTLGLIVSKETSDALYLRGYQERLHHSLVLRKGKTAMLGHLSFRVESEEDLEKLAHFYTARGCPIIWTNDAEPGQGRALRVQDPLGFPVEFFYAMSQAEWYLQKFNQYRGPHIMRLDHFNIHTPDVTAGYEYYRALGFRCSEYTVADPPADGLWAAWMYRRPSVHDVALTNGYGPRLHHVAFWLDDTNAICRACDILAASEFRTALERGPGRHGVSNAFFLYIRDPDGHRIELYTGDYYTGDPDFEPVRWVLSDPQRATFWGSYAPPSWFSESSLVGDFDGNPMEIHAPLLGERPAAVKAGD